MWGNKKKPRDPMRDFFESQREKNTDHDSVFRHEEQAAELVGGKRHKGSGSVHGHKSDASSEDFQIECKQTEKESISIKLEWLDKISREAFGRGRKPLLHIRFLQADGIMNQKDWILISAKDFKNYVVCGFSSEDIIQ